MAASWPNLLLANFRITEFCDNRKRKERGEEGERDVVMCA